MIHLLIIDKYFHQRDAFRFLLQDYFKPSQIIEALNEKVGLDILNNQKININY